MVMVEGWTGEKACRLQAAMRLSNQRFASHVEVTTRAVAGWHAKPGTVPQTAVQEALDRALREASAEVLTRFEALAAAATQSPSTAAGAPGQVMTAEVQPLRVAICVVVRGVEVLLVCRREDSGGISWQFPAGVVKPGGSSEKVAVRETLAETGVRCSAVKELGSRVHPVTGTLCEYWLADFLTGDAENRDVEENTDVVWAGIADLEKFIPLERVYGPILDALELNA